MKITEVKLYRADLPLSIPFQHSSSGLISVLQEVVAAIRTDGRVVGYGEVRGNCTYVTGDTPERIVAVASFLASNLIGKELEDFAALIDSMNHSMVGNSGAKALLDIALHDAYGRAFEIPVFTMLGGRTRSLLPTDHSVPFCSPEDAAAQTKAAIDEGYALIKVRVGNRLAYDEARLSAVRDTIDRESTGKDVALAADANGAWSPKQALQALLRWDRYHLEFIEQPVGAHDIEGLRFVRENIPIPVMADESAKGPKEIFNLIERRAVDMFHFKLIKAGGFEALRQMMAISRAAEIPYMIGQMDEGMLATAAAVHAAAASFARFFEVHGHKRVASQPFYGLQLQRGAMVVPQGPGLGIVVDESAMQCVKVIN
ncbi:MAG: dipeptide epimerase [Deltaproteobacteria bacterium]|nr:dipeptide epimerase [Deltaproteobacteria bacterium]